MEITVQVKNGVRCALVTGEELLITDAQSALDLMMTVRYDTDSDRIALHKEAVADAFFVLSSKLAGDVLQKFINYHTKLAIIGDYSGYTSKPLKDFIYESNRGHDIFFVTTEEEAIERLSRA